ncbi:MAG: HAD-IA family hydrolase [Nitrospiraceae bacterium]
MVSPGSLINVVFFDAAGTLFRVKRSVADIYLELAVPYGFRRGSDSREAITGAFKRAMQDAPPPVFQVSDPAEIKRCERLWWFDVVHNVFYRVGLFERFDDFFEEVFRRFDGPEFWELYPETIDALKGLRDRGVELGIISNFDSRLFNVLKGLGIADYFDTVTISSLARSAKPAPGIFRLALEKHALDPEEALHIGDSLRDDVMGAQKAGLAAVLIRRQGDQPDLAPPQGINPYRTIRSLSELTGLVGSR